jgi:hypothetical protein
LWHLLTHLPVRAWELPIPFSATFLAKFFRFNVLRRFPVFFGTKKASPSDPAPESGLTLALKRKDFGMIFDWFSAYFFRGATICFLLILLAAAPTKHWDSLRIVGVSFVFACACTVCGWLLGLLFGIPRTLSRPQAVPAATGGTPAPAGAAAASGPAPAPPNRVNTNLEDVSDWLTKTLIGVGLTQLYFVPHYLWQSADKLNRAGFQWEATGGPGQLLAVALFLYFAPGGFWLGYIGTRTILTKLFDSLEGPSQSDVEAALKPDALKLDPDGKIKPPDDPKIKAADAAMLNFQVTSLNTPRELAAWGAAKARANDLASASFALEQATKADPSDPVFKEALAKVYTAQQRKPEAQQLLQKDEDSEVALLNALYEEPPAGFTKAIAIGSKLKQKPDSDKNLNLHIWQACAYGQQHKFAVENKDSALAESARKNVVAEVKAALQIDAAKAKPWLQALWRPASGSPEDDLASLKDDPDLTALLL